VLPYLINQKNVDADIKGLNGFTLLHIAGKKISGLLLDVVKVLIEIHDVDV